MASAEFFVSGIARFGPQGTQVADFGQGRRKMRTQKIPNRIEVRKEPFEDGVVG
jgi:hypothetical protein